MQENPLWKYSLSVYGKSAVEPILLRLQDDFGADINMLLCCCWVAAEGKELVEEDLQGLMQVSARWRAECILPLRLMRRFLKSQQQLESMYKQVKTLELDAERWQQELLYQQLLLTWQISSKQAAAALALQNLRQYSVSLVGIDWEDIAGLLSELVEAVDLRV
jgi:uncharacterized protein (TIGR02444 family)